jgi:hypothetical protein
VHGSVIESDVLKAVGLSLFVRGQLSVDYCACEFVIFELGFESSVISSFQTSVSVARLESGISVSESEIQMIGYFGDFQLGSDFDLSGKAGIYETLFGLVD